MTPPFRDKLKLLMGIPAEDHSRDDWIEARGDTVLAQMRTKTGATLYPLRRFRDTFDGQHFSGNPIEGLTPVHHPVHEVEDIEVNGVKVDNLELYPVTTDGRISMRKCPQAWHTVTAVTYTAGFEKLPDDLMAVLVEVLAEVLNKIEAAGSASIIPERITLVDVGSIEFGKATSFADILGPFGSILDAYNAGAQVGAPLVVESVDLGAVEPTP